VRWDWENDGAGTPTGAHQDRHPRYQYRRLLRRPRRGRDGGNLTDAALHAYLVLPAAAVALEVSPPLVSLVPGTSSSSTPRPATPTATSWATRR